MRKLTTLLIFITLVLICLAAHAQTYSLQDCISAALKDNVQLQNSRLDIDAAEFRIREVKSALLPTANINGQSMYYQNVPAQYAPASAFGGPQGEYKKLSLNMRQTTSANLLLSQNIYNQSVMTGLKAAKAVREASLQQEILAREEVIYNVTATYYSIQVLRDNLGRLQGNIVNLEKTVQVDSILKANDIVSVNVHNRMLINLENLRNQYQNQKLLLDKNITTLKFLMNVDITAPVDVQSFDYNEILTTPEAGDVAQRPDVQLQQTNIRLAQLDKKSIAAGYYPVLTNNFSYGYTGYYDEFQPFKRINNDWIKSSYVALTVKIPVFDGFQKHNQLKQKEVAVQKSVNTLSMLKRNAEKEVQDALNNYAANKALLVNNKKSLDLAEQLFSSAQAEYTNGITSMTDLLNAQNDLTNARTNYSAALLNLKLAELSLKKANGTLLQKV